MVKLYPDQVNQQELLDDSSIDLETRKKLLLELDYSNTRLFVFPIVTYFLTRFISKTIKKKSALKILEIGSGSGGLASKILKKISNNYEVEYCLFDLDPDILAWAQENCKKQGYHVSIFQADSDYLKKVNDKEFDLIISLHAVHHIHPKSEVQDFFKEVARCSKHGYFIVDFQRRIGNELMLKIACLIISLSKDLIEDGIKSLKRSYLKSELIEFSKNKNFQVRTSSFFWNPYVIIQATRTSR